MAEYLADEHPGLSLWMTEGYSAGHLSDTEGYSAGDLNVEEEGRTDVNLLFLRAYLDLASDHEPYSSYIRSIVLNPVDSPDPHSTKYVVVTLENGRETGEKDSSDTPGMSLRYINQKHESAYQFRGTPSSYRDPGL